MPFSSDSEEEFDLTAGDEDEGEASGASIGCSDYSGSSSDSSDADARSSGGEESDYEEENKSNLSNREARGKSVKKQARTKTSKTIEVRQQSDAEAVTLLFAF